MNSMGKLWCVAGLLATGLLPAQAPWEAAAPESLGLDGTRLVAMSKTLAARRTKHFLVARHGKLVFEPAFPFSALTRNSLSASDAFIHAGLNVMKTLPRRTPNG